MIRRLLLLNGLAALGAVINHAAGWGFTAMFWWTDRYLPVSVPDFSQINSVSYYFIRGLEQLVLFSIPAFLFVSGYFIAFATKKNERTVAWNVIGARLKYLLIPYFIWSVLILFVKFLQGYEPSIGRFTQILLTGGAADPYYYVPLLVQLYILSPLIIIPAAKKNWKLLLFVTGALQFLSVLAPYPSYLGIDSPLAAQITRWSPSWFFASSALWFAIGVVVGFHLQAFKNWVLRMKWQLLVGTAVFYLLAYLETEILFKLSGQSWFPPVRTPLDDVYATLFVFTFIAFERAKIPYAGRLSTLGTKSYGVYLVHPPVLEYTARALTFIAPWLLGWQILMQPLLIFAGVAVPVLLMNITNRTPIRKYYKYIFG